MIVKVTKVTGDKWYKKGEIHNVGAYIVIDKYHGGGLYYEKLKWFGGINILDCKVIEVLK